MPDRIVVEELRLLEEVNAALARAGELTAPSEENLVAELEVIRAQLVQGELDFFERSSLNTRWNAQTALLEQLRRSRAAPQIDAASPYFARLRLREAGRVRDLCIGRATRLDNGLRIVDWRHAPIAQLFYRYRQGEEYEEDINGRVQQGSVVARRTVTIKARRLERIEAPEGVFQRDVSEPERWRQSARRAPRLGTGQGAALRVHSGDGDARRLGTDPSGRALHADKRLPDIAGLLDPEQFELIARPRPGYLLIRGVAGSGKTTVALHRIAFLAYHDAAINSEQTLFVALSQGLRNYVSQVLPALGIAKARVCTFKEWASEQRQRLFPSLPKHVRDDTSALAQRLKLHPALQKALERQVARNPGAATAAQAMDDWITLLGDVALLEEVFESEAPGAFSRAQLEEITTRSRLQFVALQAWLDGERDNDAALDPEDDALLLRAWQLRAPLPDASGASLRYRHIAIDEVQDFSPLELGVLMACLDEQRSLTLAGDARQQVLGSGFGDWSRFLQNIGAAGTEIETLQVSYRSSEEIMRFATAVLGGVDLEPEAPLQTTRSGPAVEFFEYSDHGACIAALGPVLTELLSHRAEPQAQVAILTPSPELSEIYYMGLLRCDVPRLHRVQQQDFRFAPGVEVTEIVQAKGLEFDYVVLVGVDAAHFDTTPESRRLLHVGATRAVHQLWVSSSGEASPLLVDAAQQLRKPALRQPEPGA